MTNNERRTVNATKYLAAAKRHEEFVQEWNEILLPSEKALEDARNQIRQGQDDLDEATKIEFDAMESFEAARRQLAVAKVNKKKAQSNLEDAMEHEEACVVALTQAKSDLFDKGREILWDIAIIRAEQNRIAKLHTSTTS